jgi:hypothetical protein
MEFFEFLDSNIDIKTLQSQLIISHLPQLCESVNEVYYSDQQQGEIYCVWGRFKINREVFDKGIRFTLPNCPNALAWTVSKESADKNQIVLHLTINKQNTDIDFEESIKVFLADMKRGVGQL